MMFENLDLLRSVLSEFLGDYERPLNYSDLSRATGRNRQLITGAVNVLYELGLVKCIDKGKTNKLFLLELPFNYKNLILKLRHLVNPHNARTNDLLALLAAEKVMREVITPITHTPPHFQEKLYSEEDWKQALAPLIHLILTPDQIHSYHSILQAEGTIALSDQFFDDYYYFRLGGKLPESARYRIVDIFHELFEYGLNNFSKEFLLDYLRKRFS